jgi:hypothetical protein
MLLWLKPLPVEIIMSVICEVNFLIWLHQAFPWLVHHSFYCISYLRKTDLNAIPSTIQRSLMKLEVQHHDTYGETFFMIYMIYFSRKYCTEEPAVQVYISPSQFSIVRENTKQMSVLHEQKHEEDSVQVIFF